LANIINGTDTGSGGLITTGDSSDELQLQTAETTAITITSGQQSAFIAGTAAAPAVTTTGDLNTGVFFPAADTIAFAEGGAEAMRISSAGKVGIGTSSPDRKLVVLDSVDDNLPAAVITKTALTGANSGLQVHTNEASASGGSFGFRVTSGSTYDSPTNEIIRVNQHGLCFNGDTAAANALDDYEEGTWTPNITSSGGGSGTGTDKAGTYTKIGRMVYASGYHVLTNKTGINAGQVRVEGLPFNASALWVGGVTFNTLNSIVQTGVQTNGGISSNFISLANVLNNGTQTAINVTELTNTSGIYFSVFYQV
jgi:hypothetical protein